MFWSFEPRTPRGLPGSSSNNSQKVASFVNDKETAPCETWDCSKPTSPRGGPPSPERCGKLVEEAMKAGLLLVNEGLQDLKQ